MKITVFCGSSGGKGERWRSLALAMADAMAERGIDLVYGGGNRGLMGLLASRLREKGRSVTGILPRSMDVPEVRTKDVETRLIIVPDMHARKAKMYELGDAFCALPGGIGTMEEFCEAYTWQQLKIHAKPVGLLNAGGYWDGLLSNLRRAVDEGFMYEENLSSLIVESDPVRLVERLCREKVGNLPDKIR